MHSFQTITKLISMQQTDKHPSSTCLLRCSSQIQRTSFHFNSHNVANGKNRRTEWYVVLQIFDVYVFIHYSHCMSYVENWIYFSTCINFISHCSWQSILLVVVRLCWRERVRSFAAFFHICCSFATRAYAVLLFIFFFFLYSTWFYSPLAFHSFRSNSYIVPHRSVRCSLTQLLIPNKPTTHWLSYYMKYNLNKFTTKINLLKTPTTTKKGHKWA